MIIAHQDDETLFRQLWVQNFVSFCLEEIQVGDTVLAHVGKPMFNWVTEDRQERQNAAQAAQRKDIEAQNARRALAEEKGEAFHEKEIVPLVHYSGCSDPCQANMLCFGLRDNKIVNRQGLGNWVIGGNYTCISKFAKWVPKLSDIQPGDLLFVRHPHHVCMVVSVQDDSLVIAEYGQFSKPSNSASLATDCALIQGYHWRSTSQNGFDELEHDEKGTKRQIWGYINVWEFIQSQGRKVPYWIVKPSPDRSSEGLPVVKPVLSKLELDINNKYFPPFAHDV